MASKTIPFDLDGFLSFVKTVKSPYDEAGLTSVEALVETATAFRQWFDAHDVAKEIQVWWQSEFFAPVLTLRSVEVVGRSRTIPHDNIRTLHGLLSKAAHCQLRWPHEREVGAAPSRPSAADE